MYYDWETIRDQVEIGKWLAENPAPLAPISSLVDVPSERVVLRPGIYLPEQARVRAMRLWLTHDQQIVTYEELSKRQEFRGTSQYPQLVLVEVWEHTGDNGHTEWQHRGWRVVTDAKLQLDLQDLTTTYACASSLPACMRVGHDEQSPWG